MALRRSRYSSAGLTLGYQKLLLGFVVAITVTAITLVCLELGAFVVVRRHISSRIWTTHPAEQMAQFQTTAGKQFWQEQRRVLEFSYHPFLQRRSRPFRGSMINVDADGHRRTVNARCESGAPVIWIFGGSTVWGFGNPDESTIPSLIAAEYVRRGKPVCVLNYGEDAWTTSQGVINLVLELKKAQRPPDVVIFLNGCNDLFTPYRRTGDPNLEWDYLEYRAALDELVTANRGSWGWIGLTNTATLWRIASRRWSKNGVPVVDRSALADRIVKAYVANIRIVEGLADRFGFHPFFYWQPMPIYGAKPLSPEESRAMDGLRSPIYRDGIDAASRVIPLIRGITEPHFRYFGDLFNNTPESVYLDACHLLPAGNRIIAEAIVSDILEAQNGRR